MAYHAGTAEEPSALVHNISSNIQKLTLLSNTHTTHTHTHTHTRALISEYMYIMWMCADKQCVLSSPASELQRAVSLLGTEQDSSQLQQTLWVMGARLGSAWPVHYSESLSTSAGGEKVKLSCQALWWIHYDAFFSAAFFFFFFLSGLYFSTFTKLKNICIWSPGNRNSSMATSSRRRPTDWWRRSAHFLLAPIRYWTELKKILSQNKVSKQLWAREKCPPREQWRNLYCIVSFLAFLWTFSFCVSF